MIIQQNHPRGIKKNLMNTAKARIHWKFNQGYENNYTCVIISTNLSSTAVYLTLSTICSCVERNNFMESQIRNSKFLKVTCQKGLNMTRVNCLKPSKKKTCRHFLCSKALSQALYTLLCTLRKFESFTKSCTMMNWRKDK